MPYACFSPVTPDEEFEIHITSYSLPEHDCSGHLELGETVRVTRHGHPQGTLDIDDLIEIIAHVHGISEWAASKLLEHEIMCQLQEQAAELRSDGQITSREGVP